MPAQVLRLIRINHTVLCRQWRRACLSEERGSYTVEVTLTPTSQPCILCSCLKWDGFFQVTHLSRPQNILTWFHSSMHHAACILTKSTSERLCNKRLNESSLIFSHLKKKIRLLLLKYYPERIAVVKEKVINLHSIFLCKFRLS